MKYLRQLLKAVLLLFALLVAFLYIFDYDYLLKAVRVTYLTGHKTAFLDDYSYFDNRPVSNEAAEIQPWPEHKAYNTITPPDTLQRLHDAYGTVAFLIIKNDSLWHESYFQGYHEDSISNSFSMAKTMVSAMLGRAIMQGKISSLEQPVGDFIPEFKRGSAGELTVGDLSSMASGLNWDESYYSPFSVTTRAYFDSELRPVIKDLQVVEKPGVSFKYLSGNTQLLGMVLEKATGMTLSEYLSREFWRPMGAEHPALWQIDSRNSGMEKAYCCIAATARDFARFGKLYKDAGNWNGQQLIPASFASLSTRPRFEASPEYGYGLWLVQHRNKHFFMLKGHLGQYVIVQPEDNLIIVRLGRSNAEKSNEKKHRTDIYGYIDAAYKMIENAS
ncbi:serine hydrolase domain-containing protein [Robertkochia aurantiaca]|uniref:serine hydrolase domain-containing protein n=1 Tax=Robertkochia aurantiaca TaxID=2873700 RepID=UPI001CCF2DC1|nr:serine hydrolase [Robertkochia sp. 3YJGBD-33]